MGFKKLILLTALVLLTGTAWGSYFTLGGVSGFGARPIGMGEAYASVADGPSAIFYNPAGLVQVLRPTISGMGAALLNGKEFTGDLEYVQPFGDQMAWAIASTELYHTEGALTVERVYYVTLATPLSINKSFSFGVNFKYYTVSSSVLPDSAGDAFGIDLGFLYHIPIPNPTYGKQINLGLSVQNLDTVLTQSNGASQQLPTDVHVGLSYQINNSLEAAFETESFKDPDTNGKVTILHAGIEAWFFQDHLGLRTGYDGFQTLNGEFTAGISYRGSSWGIDYAYIGHPQFLGSSHRISAEWRFGRSFLGNSETFVPQDVVAYVRGNIITIQWTGSRSINLEGYNVYFTKTSGSNYVKINQKPIQENYYAVRGLEKNTTYYFVVTSVMNTKPPMESQYSREVRAITTSAPVAPVLAKAQVSQEGAIDVARQFDMVSFGSPAKQGLKGYNIYMSEVQGGRFIKVNGLPIGNVPTYVVRHLSIGQTYYFRFTSVGTNGVESAPSKEVSAIALPYATVIQSTLTLPKKSKP
jgi:hypothetical protein